MRIKDKAFFITTYALSNKMQEICTNSSVAIAHNLFVAHGEAENMGHPLDIKNKALREELRRVFCVFYDKHVDENDSNTCILKINLTDAIVFADDFKYYVDFKIETATKENFIVDIVY